MLLDVGPCAAPVDVQVPDDDQLRNERLKKKKIVQTRSSLGPRTWLDKEKRKEQSTKKNKKQRYIVISYAIVLSQLQQRLISLMLSLDKVAREPWLASTGSRRQHFRAQHAGLPTV